MKDDLDKILAENDLEAMLIVGPGMHNPAMVYMTGGGHLTSADLIRRKGHKGILFHASMERDEALKSGLETRGYNQYPFGDLLKEAGGDRFRAVVLRYQRMFQDAGLSEGRVALYGRIDVGIGYSLFTALQEALPKLTFVGDLENKVLQQAMMTKDPDAIERIRQMGKVTADVVQRTADFLTGQRVRDNHLEKKDGQPLTIGEVKGQINLWLAESGAENPESTIFAIGRDAGVPHSSGNDADILELGKPIVFDIYPCEAGGGYFHDLTRTWCLGHAPDDVYALYEQVLGVYQTISAELKVNEPFNSVQVRTCELFEKMGHPSVLSTPETEVGYVHSVGHGVGLYIHERPFSGATAPADDILAPGVVMTLEPGLYYPDRGMGVRLENTYWVRPDGVFETFVNPPMDLVIPVGKSK
jgi:Xaa-Pro aminopeptidase